MIKIKCNIFPLYLVFAARQWQKASKDLFVSVDVGNQLRDLLESEIINLKNTQVSCNSCERVVTYSFLGFGAGYIKLLPILISSSYCLRVLWLVKVITFVLALRHSIENHSMHYTKAAFYPNSIDE